MVEQVEDSVEEVDSLASITEEMAEDMAEAEQAFELVQDEEMGSADDMPDLSQEMAEPAEKEDENVFEFEFSEGDAAEPAAGEQKEMPEAKEEAAEKSVAEEESFELAQADILPVAEAEPPKMPEKKAEKAAKKKSAPKRPEPSTATKEDIMGNTAAPVLPEPSNTIAPASNTFYDGRIPTGPMGSAAIREVDPELEPAQQLVVVKKAHEETDMEALLVSANRALKLKRYDSALDMFERLYAKNKRDQRILMGLAVAQQNTGRSEAAIKTYEAILDLNPNNTDAMLNMLGILRSQYPSVALRRLMDLHDKYPSNAGITAQIGVTQADLGHHDDAMRFLGMAASLEPNNAQHVFNMAIITDRAGQTKQAIQYYEKALQLDAVYASGRAIPRDTIYDRLSTLRRR